MTRWAALVTAVGVKLLCALVVGGRLHPDEVHQYLEPAHRMAFGYGNRAHEWYSGMRNMAAPSVLAGVWRLLGALGLGHPVGYLAVAWALVGVVSLGALSLLYGVVAHRRSDPADAGFAAMLVAVWVPWQEMAFRTLGETLSLAALVAALALRDGGAYAGAGLLAGLAFVLRYPAGLFVLPFCVDALWAPRRRDTGYFFLGLGVALLALGALDAATWGTWFHSVRAYASYNLLRGQAAAVFGTRPWWWYATVLPGVVPMALVAAVGRPQWRAAGLPGALALVYFLGMSLVGHKELRFVLAVAPFVMVSLVLLRAEWTPTRRKVVLGLTVLQSLLSLFAIGYRDSRMAGIQRATWSLYRRPDLVALWVMNRTHPGHSTLRRPVPISADPRGLLVPTCVALDRWWTTSAALRARGRVYAFCDAHGDAPEACQEALRSRDFLWVERQGAVSIWAR